MNEKLMDYNRFVRDMRTATGNADPTDVNLLANEETRRAL
jgi:hypothetical protein